MAEKRYEPRQSDPAEDLAADPGNLLARRAGALVEKHEFTPALQELQRVVAASGDDYVTRYELGVAQEGLGHLPEALTQFEAACRIAPAAEQCKGAIERVRGKVSGAEHPL